MQKYDRAQGQDGGMGQGFQERQVGFVMVFGIQSLLQPLSLLGPEPPGLGRPVGQIEGYDKAEDQGRNGLHDEHPLPAGHPPHAVHFQQVSRERGADDPGNGDGCHKKGRHPGPDGGWEPVGQIKDHAREKAGLSDTQKNTDCNVALGPHHPGSHGRDYPPADHNAGDPLAGPKAVEQEVAGQLKKEIADEKSPGTEAVQGFADVKGLVHIRGRVADISPVEEGDKIKEHHEGDEPPSDPPESFILEFWRVLQRFHYWPPK